MNQVERSLLWLVVGTAMMLAGAWLGFQLQQEGIAPLLIFPMALGGLLGGALLGLQSRLAWPTRRGVLLGAVVWGLLLVAAQDYLGHRQRSRQFDDELAGAHPLAAVVAVDARPKFTSYLQARIQAHPVAWTSEACLTVASALAVTMWGMRRPVAPADSGAT